MRFTGLTLPGVACGKSKVSRCQRHGQGHQPARELLGDRWQALRPRPDQNGRIVNVEFVVRTNQPETFQASQKSAIALRGLMAPVTALS